MRADLQSIMALIETDIRRAGYGGDDYLVGASGTKTIDINTNGNCIVYYYNHNKSTYLEGANKMGFKWEDNSVKFRTGVGTVANEVCDSSYVCPDTVTPDGTTKCSAWTSVSNPNFITITNLSFTENSTSNAVATMRSVDVTLAGELVADSSYKHSITTHVLVRNMEFAY